MHTHTHTHAHTHAHTHTHTYIRMHTHAHTHTCTHAQTHTHTHTRTHTYAHACAHCAFRCALYTYLHALALSVWICTTARMLAHPPTMFRPPGVSAGSSVARATAAELVTTGAESDARLSQYSAIPGTARLTAAVAAHYNGLYDCAYKAEEHVVVMTSGTEALYCAVMVPTLLPSRHPACRQSRFRRVAVSMDLAPDGAIAVAVDCNSYPRGLPSYPCGPTAFPDLHLIDLIGGPVPPVPHRPL